MRTSEGGFARIKALLDGTAAKRRFRPHL